MAIAKKCDICGAFYDYASENQHNAIAFGRIDHEYDFIYSNKNTMDCCPSCLESIKSHIEELKGDAE